MKSVFCEKAIESLTLAISGSSQEGKVPAVLSDSHVLVCVLSWTWNGLRLWASWRVIQRVIHFVHLVASCTQTKRVEVCLQQRLSLDLVEVAYDSVSSWVRRIYRYQENMVKFCFQKCPESVNEKDSNAIKSKHPIEHYQRTKSLELLLKAYSLEKALSSLGQKNGVNFAQYGCKRMCN